METGFGQTGMAVFWQWMPRPNSNQISISELKRHFSKVLREVEKGRALTITRYGVPVARLVPLIDGKNS